MIVAVVPDLPGSAERDEGFAIGSNEGADISGWSVIDGEGIHAFPANTVLRPGEPLWIVGNQTAWQAHDGPAPAGFWSDTALQLANSGDILEIANAEGQTVDSVSWGAGSGLNYTSPGAIYTRDRNAGGWVDTDRAADWVTPRIHRIGESQLDAPTFRVHNLTLYASPDSSFAVLSRLISGATERLHLHVYELRSAALVDLLVAAKANHPSLDLAVLVDAAPVGMTASERHATADALHRIQAAGGTALLAGSGRYDNHHLKVLVADDAVAVQSENWVESGVPQDPTWGNRGWGVVVHDATAAQWFATWLAADRAAWEVATFDRDAFDPLFSRPARLAPRSGQYGPVVQALELQGDFDVTPLVSPDHMQDPRRDPLAALIRDADQAIESEQLDLASGAANKLGWRSDDALTAALSAAARRGVAVRVLAAAPFGNDAGNQPTLDLLASSGARGAVFDRKGIAILHNKGLVIDDVVIVGSMNGNHHSRSANREVDLILGGPGIAPYYRALFDADWDGVGPDRDVGVVERDLRGLPGTTWPILLAGLGLALAGWMSRRGRGPLSR